MYDIAVIGGGASGLVCAIRAKQVNEKLKICILEALPRIGKKILVTGNGRCNITNLNSDSAIYNSMEFTRFAMETCSPKRVLVFFESIGLKCVEESQGRVYPMSNNSSSVLDCIRNEIEHLGIEVITDFKVDEITKTKDCFKLNNSITAKKIIISTGGKSSSCHGSDGSGYGLLKKAGHRIVEQYPALVQLKTEEKTKMLKGVRVKAQVRLVCANEVVDESGGEVLFTDYGLSGIAIMDVSRKLYDRKCSCVLDALPNMKRNEISEFINRCKKNNPDNAVENIISGMLPAKLSQYIIQGLGINPKTPAGQMTGNKLNEIIERIKNLTFKINETTGFGNAQITVGGADVKQFNPKTMESKLVKGLYCAGEILDVDAPCGGYNLQWAWSSGLLAGESMAEMK